MSSDFEPIRIWHFVKRPEGEVRECVVKVYDDSVYVDGSDVEAIFEFTADAERLAIEFVKSKGYLMKEA